MVEVTAYCPCAKCCGRTGQRTASGAWPRAGVTIGVPRTGPLAFPFGTRVRIEGLGERVVQDRMAARFTNRLDLFVPTHREAVRFGVQRRKIEIIQPRMKTTDDNHPFPSAKSAVKTP